MHKPLHDQDFWARQRQRVARAEGKVNLNAGTLSPTPLPVLEAVERLRREMAADPSNFLWRRLPVLIQHARQALGAFLNAPAEQLLLLPNVTHALNLAVASLDLPPGSEILMTDHEYGAMTYIWQEWAQRRGWVIREFVLPYRSEDSDEIASAFTTAVSEHTKVLFFSHAYSPTGLVVPAAEICRAMRDRGVISVVDGAHAPGMVPVNLNAIGADFYGANCHKWMMAPLGAGFLHVAQDRRRSVQPAIVSWGWKHDRAKLYEDCVNGGSHWQWNLEFHGSTDRCPQMVVPEAIAFQEEIGMAAIRGRVRELSDFVRNRLMNIGLREATPRHPALCGAMTAFDLPCVDPIQLRDRLYHGHHIECPVTVAAGRTFLRISTAWFNNEEELEQLAGAIAQLAH